MTTTEEITLLPEQYRRAGFDHKLVKRGQYAFLFAVYADGDQPAAYEVFKRLVSKAGMAKFGGGEPVWVPAKEKRPNDESFGKWAWCCASYDKAIKYFDTLEELKGDLKAFNELKSPNPLLKVFELHKGGKPVSMKIMGKVTNRVVKINVDDMEEARTQAKDAFAKMLGSNFDIRGCEAIFIGEERMYGKTEEDEIETEEDNDEE